ncbi:type VII secretion integral membrane protein EccD [Streptomyces sp. NPDC046821]|uniref:type VII secretion integral membrane protein EccD n=1 Tax=Streptomyces sp. NPDC046821 TaxID=3154702 RepID=UPI0033C56741
MSTGSLSHATDGGRTALSRVTLIGERRRADLVLPAREPIGVLLPEVLRLLDDQVGARPELRHLVTVDGSALAHDATLESAGVADGAVLRLVRIEDAPSAPVVHDVSDETADDLDERAWRWRPAARRVVAGCASIVWTVAAGVLVRDQFALSGAAAGLLAVAVLCLISGAVFGRTRRQAPAAALIGAGGALAVLGSWTYGDAYDWSGAVRLAGAAVAVGVTLLLAGWFTRLGRGALLGAGAVFAVLLLWEAALAVQSGAANGSAQARAGALVAVVCVVVLGVLPRVALMTSGLSGLDDRRTGGVSVSRYEVGTALAATHRGLTLATGVLAASTAAAGVLVLKSASVWAVLLSVVVLVAVALRARAFPLTAQVVLLLAASAVVGLVLIVEWMRRGPAAGPLAVLVVLALFPLAVLVVEPAEHVRVRLRRLGDAVESMAVIAMFPLVLGVFGVYERLLGTFA